MEIEDRSKTDQDDRLRDKKILWVEDDTTLNEILIKWLSRYGSQLHHSTHGQKALKMIEEDKPDVILLDILLPDMNGFEILEQIRSNDKLKDVPVMMFSNLSSDQDIEKSRELGADKYIVKSTSFLDGLVDDICEVIDQRKGIS